MISRKTALPIIQSELRIHSPLEGHFRPRREGMSQKTSLWRSLMRWGDDSNKKAPPTGSLAGLRPYLTVGLSPREARPQGGSEESLRHPMPQLRTTLLEPRLVKPSVDLRPSEHGVLFRIIPWRFYPICLLPTDLLLHPAGPPRPPESCPPAPPCVGAFVCIYPARSDWLRLSPAHPRSPAFCRALRQCAGESFFYTNSARSGRPPLLSTPPRPPDSCCKPPLCEGERLR